MVDRMRACRISNPIRTSVNAPLSRANPLSQKTERDDLQVSLYVVLYCVSRREKLVQELLSFPRTMRFAEVRSIIESHGYTHHQPRGGGSHHIFRKPGEAHISVPVHGDHVKRIYLKDVARKLGLMKETDDE